MNKRRPILLLHQALAVLAPPRRFELLLLLLSGVDRSVTQLAAAVGLSQSCTSRHLQALERAGLVKRVRDGKRVLFRPAPRDPATAGVLASLEPHDPARTAASRSTRRGPAGESPGPRAGKPASKRSPRRIRALPTGGPPASSADDFAAAAPYSDVPVVADEPSGEQPDLESGNNIVSRVQPFRVRQELEDYLL